MTRMTTFAVAAGIVLNIAGSVLIDGFYHVPTGYDSFGWSDWGHTGWALRFTGVGLVVAVIVKRLVDGPERSRG